MNQDLKHMERILLEVFFYSYLTPHQSRQSTQRKPINPYDRTHL